MPSLPFALVDVFADRPLTGNPLAVVPDADDLDDDAMRRIAREFNQSETTFLLRPSRSGADHRLRSFTAAGSEVGGAGHNALGAWLWLAAAGRLGEPAQRAWAQEIGADVLGLSISREADGRFAVTMRQAAPTFGSVVTDVEPVMAALGLAVGDLDPRLPVQVVDTGAGHLLVAVRDPATVDHVVADPRALLSVLRAVGGEGCYVAALVSGDEGFAGVDAYTRFFNPTVGIVEDPATGTAAGPLAAALVRHGVVPTGDVPILQGQAMGRPSRLRVNVDGDDVRLSGTGLVVAEGVLTI